jgi:CDP-diacylglycerol--serine O-phosphatidyltransferase
VDVRQAKYILPNLFTLASLFFGVLAIAMAMEGSEPSLRIAILAIVAAVIADGMDGRVARMTKSATRFGIELDSLADLVSFGVAPAFLANASVVRGVGGPFPWLCIVILFFYVACGAMRLARFNITADHKGKPSQHFQGLPIPAACGLVTSFIWVSLDLNLSSGLRLFIATSALLSSALLMVSTTPYPSFKRVRWGLWNAILFLSLIGALVVLAVKTKTSFCLFGVALIYVISGPLLWAARLIRKQVKAVFRAGRGDDF